MPVPLKAVFGSDSRNAKGGRWRLEVVSTDGPELEAMLIAHECQQYEDVIKTEALRYLYPGVETDSEDDGHY